MKFSQPFPLAWSSYTYDVATLGQIIGNGGTLINFDTNVASFGNDITVNGVAPYSVTLNKAGLYVFYIQLYFSNPSATDCYLAIEQNGGAKFMTCNESVLAGAGSNETKHGFTFIKESGGTLWEPFVNVGIGQTLVGNQTDSFICIARLQL